MSTNPAAGRQIISFDTGNNSPFNKVTNNINNLPNGNVNLKTPLNTDVFDKKNEDKKNTLIKGGIIAAGIAILTAGFFMLRNKNATKAAKAGNDAANAAVRAAGADEAAAKAADEAAQMVEKIVDGVNNPKFTELWYRQTPVCFDETSVEKDMVQWIERLQKAPQEASVIQRGEYVKLNNPVDIKALRSIKPHNYTDTSDIFINTRTLHAGFPDGFAVVDGKMSDMQASYNEYVDYALGKNGSDYGYRAGISKDGRACVELHFREKRQDEAKRYIHTRILLRSKDRTFTQEQIDAIRMFQNIDKEKIALNSPLGAAFMQEEEGSRSLTSLFFNKNMFLSIIKNEADKYKDFDVQGLLSKGNIERYVE